MMPPHDDVPAARFGSRASTDWDRKVGRITGDCYALAALMVIELPDGPELRRGLLGLLEARNHFLLAATT